MNTDEMAVRFGNELKQLSNEPTIGLAISPLMAWQIICQLQLALRHPENTGISSEETRHFVDTLVDEIPLSDSLKELFSMGWNPEHDHVIEPQTDNAVTEVIEVHNVATYYGLNRDGSPAKQIVVEFSRPQDWGNKQRWHYEFFKLEWVHKGKRYINNFHGWTDLKNPQNGYPELFSQCISMILMPGKPAQICGREFLNEDDFWREEWGEMPPYYDPENDEFEDDDIYE